MNSIIHASVRELINDKLSEEQFLQRLGISREDVQGMSLDMLNDAVLSRDSEAVIDGLFLAFRFGFLPAHLEVLCRLSEADWHSSHEDVVMALQELRNPAAVAILEKVTFSIHKYLDYDENFGLARKCTWALADIGSPEAHQALTRIAGCANPMIAAYAKKRLDNWEKELDRKGI